MFGSSWGSLTTSIPLLFTERVRLLELQTFASLNMEIKTFQI